MSLRFQLLIVHVVCPQPSASCTSNLLWYRFSNLLWYRFSSMTTNLLAFISRAISTASMGSHNCVLHLASSLLVYSCIPSPATFLWALTETTVTHHLQRPQLQSLTKTTVTRHLQRPQLDVTFKYQLHVSTNTTVTCQYKYHSYTSRTNTTATRHLHRPQLHLTGQHAKIRLGLHYTRPARWWAGNCISCPLVLTLLHFLKIYFSSVMCVWCLFWRFEFCEFLLGRIVQKALYITIMPFMLIRQAMTHCSWLK